jgi:hypothetical protein
MCGALPRRDTPLQTGSAGVFRGRHVGVARCNTACRCIGGLGAIVVATSVWSAVLLLGCVAAGWFLLCWFVFSSCSPTIIARCVCVCVCWSVCVHDNQLTLRSDSLVRSAVGEKSQLADTVHVRRVVFVGNIWHLLSRLEHDGQHPIDTR